MIIPEIPSTVCALLRDKGFQAYIVGGAIRDHLMGIEPHDFDIATNATPKQVRELFSYTTLYSVVGIGEKYGTVLVIEKGIGQCEVTTFRSDGKYTDKRHPDQVTFSDNIETDLARRDFTINAIAYEPHTKEFYDPYGGLGDIKRKVLRTVGKASERFEEDPIRMIRLARFVGRLGFSPNPEAWEACKHLGHLLLEVPVERIRNEILKALETERVNGVYDFFSMLANTELLYYVIPELSRLRFSEQPSEYHKYNVMVHSILTAEMCPSDNVWLRLTGLLHDLGKISMNDERPFFPGHEVASEALARKILTDWKCPTVYIDYVCHLIKHHMDCPSYKNYTSDKSKRRYLRRFKKVELLPDLFELQRADIKAMGMAWPHFITEIDEFEVEIHRILAEVPPLTTHDLAISGHDLMALGVKPSPQMSGIMNILLENVIDHPENNNKEYLLNIVKLIIDPLSQELIRKAVK